MTPSQTTALNSLDSKYAEFWQWFSQHERQFFQAVKDLARVEENFFELLYPALNTIKPDLSFQTGMMDEHTVELQFSAGGVIENLGFVEELVSAAPSIPGWQFTALKKATDIALIRMLMEGYPFNTDTLNFSFASDAAYPDIIDIVVVHRDYTEENSTIIQSGVHTFLENYLGELALATTIDRLSVTGKTAATNEPIPIEKLQDFLRWRQKEFVEKYEAARYNPRDNTRTIIRGQFISGNQLLAVINTKLLNWDGKASHPWVMVVMVAYDGTRRAGMPDNATCKLLDNLESRIIAELPDFDGYLKVGRQTGDNRREIYFACQDFRKPSKVLYQFQQDYAETFDIEYSLCKDKYWQTYMRFTR